MLEGETEEGLLWLRNQCHGVITGASSLFSMVWGGDRRQRTECWPARVQAMLGARRERPTQSPIS